MNYDVRKLITQIRTYYNVESKLNEQDAKYQRPALFCISWINDKFRFLRIPRSPTSLSCGIQLRCVSFTNVLDEKRRLEHTLLLK